MESGPFLETKLSNSTPVTVNNNVNTFNVPVSSICSDVTVGLLTSYEQNLFSSDILGERGGSVVECRTPEREVGVRDLPLPCCVLEQDTLLPESTG